MTQSRYVIGRRAWLGAAGLTAAGLATAGMATVGMSGARAAELPKVRLGVLQYGTVQWVADVIRRNHLDAAHGVMMRARLLANHDAGQIALMAGSADVIVTDWMMVASQRAAGHKLCFAPFSGALGAIMVRADSQLHTLADLRGKRLGVAGGPFDKSWLLVRAAARKEGIDLAAEATIAYGAPPLLDGKFRQGDLDAVLTFWTFVARLKAKGYREMRPVADVAQELGLPAQLGLVGFVFHEDWARAHRPAIDGFLAAAGDAERLLAARDAEWHAIRPLMNARDPALFAELKRQFLAGMAHPTEAEEARTAAQVFEILKATGGRKATAGLAALPPGVFWPTATGA